MCCGIGFVMSIMAAALPWVVVDYQYSLYCGYGCSTTYSTIYRDYKLAAFGADSSDDLRASGALALVCVFLYAIVLLLLLVRSLASEPGSELP